MVNVYEFGCAPQAVEEGFAPSVTIEYGTLVEVMAKYDGQDVAIVYGAKVHGTNDQFEFAVLKRPVTSPSNGNVEYVYHETIIREFSVWAANMDEAKELAMNCSGEFKGEHCEGLTYIRAVESSEELIL